MWNVERLKEDLLALGLPRGCAVLTHVSMRAVGASEEGALTLLKALQDVLGPDGTIVAPAFTPQFRDPAEWRYPPEMPEQLKQIREASGVFDSGSSTALPSAGVFAETLRLQPGCRRSFHPTHSFVAVGPAASQLLADTPFHYPLGSHSVPARLHSMDGRVLLIGVGMDVNISLHLAEVWANVPYIHTTASVRNAAGEYVTMRGSVECQDGFSKIEPLLRQARLVRKGYVGSAVSVLIRQTEQISMAIAMMQGQADSLLCDMQECRHCQRARRMSADQTHGIDG